MSRKLLVAGFALTSLAGAVNPFDDEEKQPLLDNAPSLRRSDQVLSYQPESTDNVAVEPVDEVSKYDSCQRRATTDPGYTAPVAPTRENCYAEGGEDTKIVEVFFARHAESEWNKGGTTVGKILTGFSELRSGASGSKVASGSSTETTEIRDAPLSAEGIAQAIGLRAAVDHLCAPVDPNDALGQQVRDFKCPLKTDDRGQVDPHTVFAASNLKRAVLTFLIGLGGKMRDDPNMKLHILSALQETSPFGIDAWSNAGTGRRPELWPVSLGEQGNWCPFTVATLTEHIDPTCNFGDQVGGHAERLTNFCDFVRKHANRDQDPATRFVVVGHSMWLVDFFKIKSKGIDEQDGFFKKIIYGKKKAADTSAIQPDSVPNLAQYMGAEVSQDLARRKLQNAGMVRFKLIVTPEGCQIEPGTSFLLHNGLEVK